MWRVHITGFPILGEKYRIGYLFCFVNLFTKAVSDSPNSFAIDSITLSLNSLSSMQTPAGFPSNGLFVNELTIVSFNVDHTDYLNVRQYLL